MKFNQNWLLAIGIAIPALFPNIAHSRPVDPIGDIIGAKMGWDQPAPRTAPKPVTKPRPAVRPVAPNTEPIATEEARKAADAAERTAHDFKFALAFSR